MHCTVLSASFCLLMNFRQTEAQRVEQESCRSEGYCCCCIVSNKHEQGDLFCLASCRGAGEQVELDSLFVESALLEWVISAKT